MPQNYRQKTKLDFSTTKYGDANMGRVKGSITKDRSIDAEALREVLKPIYEKLREKGVSDADLPNNEDLVDRLLDYIDEKAVDEWAIKYADWVKQKP